MIRKLNQLKNTESFIQIDYVKGFKYVDTAGQIVNKFVKDNNRLKFEMGLNQLVIQNPDEYITELKVSPYNFWTHYIKPNSLDQTLELTVKNFESINELLEVNQISRIGWRNYFIYNFQETAKLNPRDLLRKLYISDIEGIEIKNYSLLVKRKNSNINAEIGIVQKEDSKNEFGVIFDLDFYKEFKENISTDNLTENLRELKQEIVSDETVKFINSILEKILV